MVSGDYESATMTSSKILPDNNFRYEGEDCVLILNFELSTFNKVA